MMRAAMHVARNASRRPGETNLLTICTSLSGELVESLFCESVESLLGESFESLSVESVDSLLRKWVDRFDRERFRSEEHTSELQSLTNLVCRLLLEKKKKM